MQKAEVEETLCGQVYFSNRQTGMPEYAIVSYTEDGATVFGLSTNVHAPDPFEAPSRFREEMQSFLGVSNGYSFIEDPPPRSRQEFEANEREFTKTPGA